MLQFSAGVQEHIDLDKEASLIIRARQGDEQAQEALVLSLVPKVRAFVSRYKRDYFSTSHTLEVDDLLQEAVLRMWDKLALALTKERPVGYLLVIAFTAIRHYCRLHASSISTPYNSRSYHSPIPVASLDAPLGHDEEDWCLLDLIATPSGVPSSPREYSSLYQALEQLSKGQRAILTQRYGLYDSEPQTLPEIAREHGVSLQNVYQQHKQGLSRLALQVEHREVA